MWIHTVDDVAQLVRDRRKQLGLSQAALADRASVSRHWLVELEQGKPTAEVALVLRTLVALGLRVDVSNPEQRPEPAEAASIIEAGQKTLENHAPAGVTLRRLRTRAPRGK
jgi:HTH-type transcriptional regulator / antitoxin HipB